MSVSQAQQLIGAREFEEWRILEQVEPWGDRRLDYHFSRLATQIANLVREKGTKPYEVKDFLPQWSQLWKAIVEESEDQPMTEEEAGVQAEQLFGKVANLNVWYGGDNKTQ